MKDARFDEGRWIVPGEVPLFTMRGKRALDFKVNGEEVTGFLVPLPARPGRQFLEWSDWGPRPPAPNPPWPDTKPSYRFRLKKIPEPPPAPTQEENEAAVAQEEQEAFERVTVESPLADWFPYVHISVREDRRALAIARLTSKPTFLAEMRALILGEDAEKASSALRLIEYLPTFPPELSAIVTAAGRDLAKRFQGVNATPVNEDPSYQGAANVSIRFSGWMVAVRTLRENAGGDFTPELKTLLELSRIRTDSLAMRGDVCRVASCYLKEWAGIEPLPTDPKPK